MTWRKPSACMDPNNTCVEIEIRSNSVAMRDSKDPTGPTLVFTPDEWSAFVSGVRAGEFEVPAVA